ncbi:MAG: hypothetical protein Q7R92_00675 [bacterium]|nr:hypothetical protein [bacterium]
MGNFYQKNKKISSLFLIIILVIGSFGLAHFAWAGAIDKAVSFVVGGIASLIIVVCGWILGVAISGILTITSYNNFINEKSIIDAWVVVRDLCNMFFILILLMVAFATILRIESYQWKKILPKLLIMAVLINFSKTICGLLIDFSQVIMLTFVNAFSDTGGNFVNALHVKDYLAVTKNQASWWDETGMNLNLTNTVAAMMFVIILMVVATVAMLAIMVIFLMRMIMLWIYIILSPFAFLLMAFPQGQKYASQWWSEFVKYLINGPVLAFFIWLTLIVMDNAPKFENSVFFDKVTGNLSYGQNSTIQALQTGTFISFIMAIGLLVGGLMISQQIGGLGASWGMSALGNLKNKGLGLAKTMGKFAGGVAGYVPAQYAKKAGYDLGDKMLGGLGKIPIVGNLALEGKGRLRKHRNYAEEKDTMYMQYLDEKDVDKIIARQRSRGAISWLGRGMESKKQLFNRALVRKAKGDEWGQTIEEKMANKTRFLIDLGEVAGHSITASGEDAFRDAEKGKLWNEFRNSSAGMIDDEQMRVYYFGGKGNALDKDGDRKGQEYNYKGLEGDAANSEYFRVGGWKDDKTGYWYEREDPDNKGHGLNFVSPDSMSIYTGMRQRMNEFFGMHHENYAPHMEKTVNADGTVKIKYNYKYLNAVYDEGKGPMKTFAQIRDRGTRQQKIQLRGFMEQRLKDENADGWSGSTKFKDAYKAYRDDNKLEENDKNLGKFLDASMANGGISAKKKEGDVRDVFGNSRPKMGETHSAEVASGITGLNRADRGVMAANFSELGLEDAAAKHFAGDDKTEIASRIKSSLQNNGLAEAAAKAVEDQINKASYLILHNREAGVSPGETKTAHAHELMHARVGANFSQDELKGVWNSMDENSKNDARKQISAKWGGKMSEEAIMNEYFAEGLTAKTRWGKGAVTSLDKKAEGGLDNLLKAKGSNITAFTSNVMQNRPTSDDVSRSMADNVDGSLKETLDELIGTLKDVGNGFSSIENFSSDVGILQRSMERNRMSLEKSTKGYKNVTDKLNSLSSKIS